MALDRRARRDFTEDYKIAQVAAWQAGDKQIREFAAEIDIVDSVFRRWIETYGDPTKRWFPRRQRLGQDGTPRADGHMSNSPYPESFRKRAVRAVKMAMKEENLSRNRAFQAVADAINVHVTTVRDWVQKAETGHTRKEYVYKRREQPAAAPEAPKTNGAHPAPALTAMFHPPQDPFALPPTNRVIIQGHIVENVPEPVVLYVRYLESELNKIQGDREIGIQFATMLAQERQKAQGR